MWALLRNKAKNLPLLFLCIFHAIYFVVFQILNRSYQTWDSAGHIGTSFLIADKMKGLLVNTSSITDIIKSSNYYPPFVQILGSFVALLFGYSSEKIIYISLVFFLLAIIYLFKLILLLSEDRDIALLSAFFFSFFPEVTSQARVFHLDLPLVSLTIMALYYVVLSQGLTKTRQAFIFFVLFGLAQLTKWYAFIYLIVPTSYLIIGTLKTADKSLRRLVLRNTLFGIVFFIIMVLPWYLVNFNDLIRFSSIFSQPELDDPQNLWSLQSFFYYPVRIMVYQLLFLPFLMTIVGFILYLRKDKKQGVVLLLSIFFPLLVFTFIRNKNLRYLLPMTPYFALFASYLLLRIKEKSRASFPIVVIVCSVYIVLSSFFLSFNQFKPQSSLLKSIGLVLAGPNYMDWFYNPTIYSYEPNVWPVKDVLTFIYKDASYPLDKGLGVTTLVDSKNFSLATFEMLRREMKYSNMYVPVPYFQFEPFKNYAEVAKYFEDNYVDYIVAPIDPGPEGLRNYQTLNQVLGYLSSLENTKFEAIKFFNSPDGNVVHVFKRKVLGGVQNESCIQSAGFYDGIESIKLEKNTTYLFYTGHFAIDKISRDYQEGVLYILQLENVEHQSVLDVYNLPHRGATLCKKNGLVSELISEIRRPLVEKGHCGSDCKKVVHVKWRVGDASFEAREYERKDF
ncbi:MAG: glycosyltransferase family 39 protein [Patescibacteria group bacterium]